MKYDIIFIFSALQRRKDMPVIRPAREYDAGVIATVSNEAIAAGDCNCDTVTVTVLNSLDGIASHPPGEYPIFI